MNQPRTFEISERSMKYIRHALEEVGRELKREMEIGEIDHLRISLDLDGRSTGKFMGVKLAAFKSQQAEVVYDSNLEVKK